MIDFTKNVLSSVVALESTLLNLKKNWQFLKNLATKKTLTLLNSNVILHFWLTQKK